MLTIPIWIDVERVIRVKVSSQSGCGSVSEGNYPPGLGFSEFYHRRDFIRMIAVGFQPVKYIVPVRNDFTWEEFQRYRDLKWSANVILRAYFPSLHQAGGYYYRVL